MRKSQALKTGDKVAIVSLSSGILGEESCLHQLNLGKKRLRELGLEPVFMTNTLKGTEYLKNHPEARAQDLKEAFQDTTIKGIITAIGGDDTYRLLPYLLEDEKFIHNVKENPKLFTGFSDTTINHLMFYKLGMVSFYGPSFITDIAELAEELVPYTKETLQGYFEGYEQQEIRSSPFWYEERSDFSERALGGNRKYHDEKYGYEVLQGTGVVSGPLLGGCLESFYDILTGGQYSDQTEICEKYQLFPSLSEWEGKILFLETCEEKPTPDVLKKELSALKKIGIFSVINGLIIGKPQDEVYYEEYEEIYLKVIEDSALPILYNVNFGHAYPRCALPYGIKATVNLDEKIILLDESCFKKS
ncbi:S66 peptidase family protein [Carnobacterium sp. ISL-102]|uniref:S66 family peptidase n=1 Tax=Carnobacterium sp. ISL-102 TaxID=2819142 RepID=UPI001BE9D595|nr:S66 peptidase family protein [Carnobacterium sp. ISL-102]MBT2731148.1 LD-carboxypeptidase [Carnobacterium sp. ISL-102]